MDSTQPSHRLLCLKHYKHRNFEDPAEKDEISTNPHQISEMFVFFLTDRKLPKSGLPTHSEHGEILTQSQELQNRQFEIIFFRLFD